MNLEGMSPDTRRKLLQMACVAAWSDLDVSPTEKDVVLGLAAELAVGETGLDEVKAWLKGAPPEFDPYDIPRKHRTDFLEALERVIRADGRLDPEECVTLGIIRELVS